MTLTSDRRFRLYVRLAEKFEDEGYDELAAVALDVATEVLLSSPDLQMELRRLVASLPELDEKVEI